MRLTNYSSQLATAFVAVLGLSFRADFASAQPISCKDYFSPGYVRARSDGDSPLIVKRTFLLGRVTQKLRQVLISSGSVDTTKLRSEFKHYNLRGDADALIRRLQEEFPPIYDISGKLLEGINSRDSRVRANGKRIELAMGAESFLAAREQGLASALLYADVLAQHRPEVTIQLTQIAGGNSAKAREWLGRVDELHAQAAAMTKKSFVYTDTSSTAKFRYNAETSRIAIEQIARRHGIKGMTPALAARIRAFKSFEDKRVVGWRERTREKLRQAGNRDETSIDGFISEIEERAFDEGVIRFRKYRIAAPDARFIGIADPSSGRKADASLGITDAPFANDVVWFEFKMKATEGDQDLGTVVNKPRFPISDSRIQDLLDRRNFLGDAEFELTRMKIKEDIRANIESMQSRGIKEAKWEESEIDAALELARALHKDGFSFAPVGRTIYTRDSNNLNLRAPGTKLVHNVQLTRDSRVWELDRTTGKMVQALPFNETTRGLNFQFDPMSGWHVHRSKDGKVELVMHRSQTDRAFPVKNGKPDLDHPVTGLKLEEVEVVELKVPLQFIRLNEEDITAVPRLALVRSARQEMIALTEKLNRARKSAGLEEFSVDRGKRSTSRKDLAGGLLIQVEKDADARTFTFNPESGYWVSWRGEVPAYAFHPDIGAFKIDYDPARPGEIESRRVPFSMERLESRFTE